LLNKPIEYGTKATLETTSKKKKNEIDEVSTDSSIYSENINRNRDIKGKRISSN
jgi:hypothetical protein